MAKHVRHVPYDRTPKHNPQREVRHDDPFTPENCDGYTPEEMRTLNAEFVQRWNGGDWAHADYVEAMNTFQDEVAQR